MTKEEIIEMAKKCGWDNPATNMMPLYEFAKLVADKEREACAKMCDGYSDGRHANMADLCAEAIRARGNHD